MLLHSLLEILVREVLLIFSLKFTQPSLTVAFLCPRLPPRLLIFTLQLFLNQSISPETSTHSKRSSTVLQLLSSCVGLRCHPLTLSQLKLRSLQQSQAARRGRSPSRQGCTAGGNPTNSPAGESAAAHVSVMLPVIPETGCVQVPPWSLHPQQELTYLFCGVFCMLAADTRDQASITDTFSSR